MADLVSELDIENLKILREGVKTIIKKAASLKDRDSCKVLDVAPQVWNGAKEFFIHSEIDTLDIDPYSNATYIADITKTNSDLIADSFYDVVILTEVLEHTLDPFSAAREIYRILKPGGYLFMTTPLNFRMHNPLPDCWRFTEHGLRVVLKDFSSVDIQENGTSRFLFPVQYLTVAIK